MTTTRPYRAAMTEADALIELARVAGSQLDRKVVDALRSVLARPRERDPATAQQ
jgi:HD-GYP domain-containing protein (c-di-GMP phosphodiesterase class II)